MKIFISAVSDQFKACRDAIASDLRAVGAEVVVQEDFQQHGRSLLEKLEEYIDTCDRVIVLVGNAYGFAPGPKAQPQGKSSRSYTQWEYFFSQGERLDRNRVAAKETFVYFASPDFLASHPVEQTEEVRKLQKKFTDEIRQSGKDRNTFGSLHELRALVLRDGFRLGKQQDRSKDFPHLPPGLTPEFLSALGKLAFVTQPILLEDLFEVVTNSEAIPEAIFRTAGRQGISPYDVPYIERREGETSIRQSLDEKLRSCGGAMLIRARAGLGKTRELADLAARFCECGGVVCVAKGEGDIRMNRLSAFPDALRGSPVLFVLDDLHRRVISSTNNQESYVDRLGAFIKFMETSLLPGEMFVVATTRSEKHHMRHLEFDAGHEVWRRFRVFDLPEYTIDGLQEMLMRLSRCSNIRIDEEKASDMVLNSDRTPRTIVLNVDRAQRSGDILTPDTWLPSQGRTWEVCFREACGFWPTTEYVYQSLQLVYESGMPTRSKYINELAGELAGTDTSAAVDGLIDMGLLGFRSGLLDAFSDEQLRDSLITTGHKLPKIEDHWFPLTTSVLRAIGEHKEWHEDLRSLMMHDSLSAESRERMATEAISCGHQHADVYSWRAIARFNIRDFTGAEADSTEAIARGQVDFFGFRGLTRCMRAMDENNKEVRNAFIREAENDFDKALHSNPEEEVSRYFRGIARAELGKYAQAEEDFDKAIMIGYEPELGAARFRRGQVREDQGRNREAEADYTEAIEQGRDDSTLFYRRANVRMKLSEFADAIEDFSEAINRGRKDAGVFMQRGLAQLAIDEFEGAEKDFSDAAKINPELAESYYFRGRTRHIQKSFIEAEQDYSRAIELGYEEADVFGYRGSLRQKLDRFSEAESDLTQAIERGMDEANVYVERAFARFQQGAMSGAVEDFTRAIDRGEQSAAMYYFRGIASDDLKAAEADLTLAIMKGIDDVNVYANRAYTRIRLGNLDGAREDCECAREQDPDSANTHRCWGDLHLSMRGYDDAISLYEAAIDAEDNPAQRFALGLAQLLSGRLEEAEATYSAALESASVDDAQYAASEIENWAERQQDRFSSPGANGAKAKILSELTARYIPDASTDGATAKKEPGKDHEH